MALKAVALMMVLPEWPGIISLNCGLTLVASKLVSRSWAGFRGLGCLSLTSGPVLVALKPVDLSG